MIDGGLGQLMAAMEGLRTIGRTELAMIGLAKARGEKEERVFLPGRKNPVLLNPSSPATHLLQRIRDEAHRFAITYHRKLRGKALVASELDGIIGIGTIRRNRLLKTFGNLEKIAGATDDQLRRAGLDAKTVGEVRKALSSGRPI
jgi:excinuclease ABC subunit C